MKDFEIFHPVHILFGRNSINQLREQIPEKARILLTFGSGSIKRNGIYEIILDQLKDYQTVEFGQILPNPDFDHLVKGIKLAREKEINFILAVGGGSVIDGSKFIAAGINYDGDLWDLLRQSDGFIHQNPSIANTVPLGVVLTLSAAGSEWNCGGVISRYKTHDKLPFLNTAGFPKFSILNPEFTFSVSLKQTANGIVDALIHICEQYLTHLQAAPLQDRLSEALLLTLIEEGPKALIDPHNYEVRSNLMFSATLALNGLIGSGVVQDWSSHLIGHVVTALHGLDHGESLAVIYPALLEIMIEKKETKIAQFGRRVWGLEIEDNRKAAQEAIQQMRKFFEKLGIRLHLSDYGVIESDLDQIVEKLEQYGQMPLGENADINSEQVRKILQLAL